jgi:hypothetical protein
MVIVMVPSDPFPQVTGVVDTLVIITSCACREITDEVKTERSSSRFLRTFIAIS